MMIPPVQRVLALVFSVLLLGVIVQLIRRRRLREEYALIWLMAGLTIVLLTVFGGLVNSLASALSVSYAPTLILVLGLLFAMVILLSQSVAISTQADRLRDLAQAIALQESTLCLLDQRLQQTGHDGTRRTTDQPELAAEAGTPASGPAPGSDLASQRSDSDLRSTS